MCRHDKTLGVTFDLGSARMFSTEYLRHIFQSQRHMIAARTLPITIITFT